MYLKIEYNGEEYFHSFPDKKRILIGRSPNSHIQLMVEGISRNHCEVHEKLEGEFYLVDKGSTHGTFINDERLEPNTPIPFNTFFPAYLGPNVSLFLLDELVEDLSEEEEDEVIKSLPPKEQITKKKPLIYVPSTSGQVTSPTKKVLQKSKKATTKKSSAKKKSSKKRKKKISKQKQLTIIFALCLITYFGYIQWSQIEAKKQAKLVKIQKQKEAILKEEQIEREKELQRMAEEKKKAEVLRQNGFIKEVVNKDKCLSEIEVDFCKLLKQDTNRSMLEGAVKELDTVYIVIDIETMKQRFEKYKYDVHEVLIVNKAAQTILGRAFHPGYFATRQDMKLKDLPDDFVNSNYFAFADFSLSIGSHMPRNIPGVDKIIIIGIKNNVYKSFYKYDYRKLLSYDFSTNKFLSILLLRSNISRGFQKTLENLQLIN